MKLHLTEKDFEKALGKDWIATRVEGTGDVLAEGVDRITDAEKRREILDALPTVLANRIRNLLPKEFRVREIHLGIDLEGKPFGVGIGGSVEFVLERSD